MSAPSCYHCGAPFYGEDLDAIRELLVRKGRVRIFYGWIVAAIFGLSFGLIDKNATVYSRLFDVLYFEVVIAAVVGFMFWLQAKATAQSSEGEAFREGSISTRRAVFWTCFAAVGVFCVEYWPDPYHLWRALGAAIFTFSVIGGVAFLANWSRGEHGKQWARKYRRQIVTVYALILAASVMLKLWDIYGHVTQTK
ncbi:MAG TPA: hypothetical protein VH280_07915 [Verrucomicrobiae bacterium]|nr:hypothetical protein [Verrucomicrobiae bacterium]